MPANIPYDQVTPDQLHARIEKGENTFEQIDCSGMDFTGITLDELTFTRCHFDHTKFDQNELYRLRFIRCSLIRASFVKSTIVSCEFKGCNFKNATFEQANITDTPFQDSSLDETDMTRARLDGTMLVSLLPTENTIRHAIIDEIEIKNITVRATLFKCLFKNVTFNHANFEGSTITKCSFIDSRFNNCAFMTADGKGKIEASNFSLAHFNKTTFNAPIDAQTRFFGATMDVASLTSYGRHRKEIFGVTLSNHESASMAQLGEKTYIRCNFEGCRFDHAWFFAGSFSTAT